MLVVVFVQPLISGLSQTLGQALNPSFGFSWWVAPAVAILLPAKDRAEWPVSILRSINIDYQTKVYPFKLTVQTFIKVFVVYAVLRSDMKWKQLKGHTSSLGGLFSSG